MSVDNVDHADLSAVDFGGLVAEDVDLNRVWDISWISLPFTDRLSSRGVSNAYAEWTKNKLQAQNLTNRLVDGQKITQDDSNLGTRVGAHCQVSGKRVEVSFRARAAGTIAFADALADQVMYRQQELRRDVEGMFLEDITSRADDGTNFGITAGFPSWLETNTSRGVGGADGGFASGNTSAGTPGEARALTETLVRDMAQAAWEQGGDPSILMSTPSVIRGLSEYMFTSSARIATLQRDSQGMEATALGTVTVFLTDFGVTLEFLPNRLQPTYQSGDGVPVEVAHVFIWDPRYVRKGVMYDYRMESQGREGLSDPMQMSHDYQLQVVNEEAHALIADIDPTLPVTLS